MPRSSTTLPSFLVERQQSLVAALDSIAPRCEQPPCEVHRSIRYTLLGPSKRVRGVLTLLVADLFGATEDPIAAAAAIEMVHASSLILDDLPAMDDTATRRGRPANHVEFGEATAILAAVELLTLAFGHLASAYEPALAASLARMLAQAIGSDGLIGGQAADLQLPAQPLHVSEIEPVDEQKTAVLFRAAAEAGARVGGAGERDLERMADFGDRMGLAFQIVDDIIDTIGERRRDRSTGRGEVPPSFDEVQDAPSTGAFLRTTRRAHSPSLADLAEAKQRADELSESAIVLLAPFGDRADRLREMARFVVNRKE